jgi:hypothetical protein
LRIKREKAKFFTFADLILGGKIFGGKILGGKIYCGKKLDLIFSNLLLCVSTVTHLFVENHLADSHFDRQAVL